MDTVDERRAVDLLHLLARGAPRDHELQSSRQVGLVRTRQHGLQALRALRVTSPGVVVEIALMGDEEDGHEAVSVPVKARPPSDAREPDPSPTTVEPP